MRSGSSMISAVPTSSTPRSSSYVVPSSTMQVMVGLRSRLRTFCDFAFVSNAIAPSRNPYHIATTWIVESWFIVANDMVRPSWRNASTSASVILMTSRCFTP